jgi:D-serine dehydratase
LADALPQDKQSRLESLVPKIFRLQPQTVQAYAIIDTEVRNILDDDGLIAADYLDSVSGEIGQQFGDLLALEFGE